MPSLCRTFSIVALGLALTTEASRRHHKRGNHHQHHEQDAVVVSVSTAKAAAVVEPQPVYTLADIEAEIANVWKHKEHLQTIGRTIETQSSMLKQSMDLERESMDSNSLAAAKDQEDETRKLLKNSETMLATAHDAAVQAAKQGLASTKAFLQQEERNEKTQSENVQKADAKHAQAIDDEKSAHEFGIEAEKQLHFFSAVGQAHPATPAAPASPAATVKKETPPAFLQQSRRSQVEGPEPTASKVKETVEAVNVADRMPIADLKTLVERTWGDRDRITDLKKAVKDAHALVKDEMSLVSMVSGGVGTETIVEDQKMADSIQAHSIGLFKQLRHDSILAATRAMKAAAATEKFAAEEKEASRKATVEAHIAAEEAKEHVVKAQKLITTATSAVQFFETWDVIKDPKAEHVGKI